MGSWAVDAEGGRGGGGLRPSSKKLICTWIPKTRDPTAPVTKEMQVIVMPPSSWLVGQVRSDGPAGLGAGRWCVLYVQSGLESKDAPASHPPAPPHTHTRRINSYLDALLGIHSKEMSGQPGKGGDIGLLKQSVAYHVTPWRIGV